MVAWAEKAGSALLDFGAPVGNGQYVMPGGEAKPTASDISGYSIVQAESMDAALALAHDHPHLLYPGGCEIEVLEAGDVSGARATHRPSLLWCRRSSRLPIAANRGVSGPTATDPAHEIALGSDSPLPSVPTTAGEAAGADAVKVVRPDLYVRDALARSGAPARALAH